MFSDETANTTYDNKNQVVYRDWTVKMRTSEGLRTSIGFAVHYKVGVSFDNYTKLGEELLEFYYRFDRGWT